MSKATITDVGFLGLFPKKIFQVLRTYTKELEQSNEGSAAFFTLHNCLFNAFIYRPITIQKVIHILLAAFKNYLEKLDKRREENTATERRKGDSEMSIPPSSSIEAPPLTLSTPTKNNIRKCYATKCRLLQAKGILRKSMI